MSEKDIADFEFPLAVKKQQELEKIKTTLQALRNCSEKLLQNNTATWCTIDRYENFKLFRDKAIKAGYTVDDFYSGTNILIKQPPRVSNPDD